MQKLDLVIDRWTSFVRTFAFVGYDFTSAAYKMQIRQVKDVNPALITLTTQTTDIEGVRTAYAGTDTLANHLAAGRLDGSDISALLGLQNPATGSNFMLSDSILLSLVGIRINKATIAAAIPINGGLDYPAYYDLHITPSGGDETNFVGGVATIAAGVTQ